MLHSPEQRDLIAMAYRPRAAVLEFSLVAAAQAFMLLGGLATIKLLSNLLEPREFGIFSLLFSVASLLVASLFGPLGQINMRFLLLERAQDTLSHFYANQRKLLFLAATISAIICMVWALTITFHPGQVTATFLALLLLTLMMGYQTSQQFELMAYRKRLGGSIAQIIGAIARPLSVFLAITYFGALALPATFGLGLGFALLCLSQYFFLRKTSKDARSNGDVAPLTDAMNLRTIPSSYLTYGAFYALQGAVTAVVMNADRWVLSAAAALEQVAIFAALMQISSALTGFSFAVLTRYATPIYFGAGDKSAATKDRQHKSLLLLWLALCAGIILLCSLFHHQITLLITNATFAAHSHLLPWMVMAILLERTAQVLEMKGGMQLKTNIYVMPRLAIIALVPITEFIFLYLFGFGGMVFGLITATVLSLLAIITINQRLSVTS